MSVKTYAMDMCYSKALADAKKIHRSEGKFYMDKIGECFLFYKCL